MSDRAEGLERLHPGWSTTSPRQFQHELSAAMNELPRLQAKSAGQLSNSRQPDIPPATGFNFPILVQAHAGQTSRLLLCETAPEA